MQNQAAVEALYSATFVEDYLDTVENLPNDIQRHLSALRELDLLLCKEFLSDLDTLIGQLEKESSSTGQRQILAKIQKGLIAAQDIGDDKLAVAQAMTDIIENRARQLEHSAKNLDFEDDEDEDEIVSQPRGSQSNANVHASNVASSANATNNSQNGNAKQSGGGGNKRQKNKDDNEKSAKRRRKGVDRQTSGRNEDGEDNENTTSSTGSKGGGKSKGGSGTSARKLNTRRKQTKKSNQDKADRDDSDHEIDLSSLDIDPDEPTYCLCDQVSYGDMIGCDNDLCPIEWFHFQCVQLSNKPKGKWFCPKCRGDKPTVMKPKAQFLKELEKFNKEREEKMMKQGN